MKHITGILLGFTFCLFVMNLSTISKSFESYFTYQDEWADNFAQKIENGNWKNWSWPHGINLANESVTIKVFSNGVRYFVYVYVDGAFVETTYTQDVIIARAARKVADRLSKENKKRLVQ